MLDPLFPALRHTATHWSADARVRIADFPAGVARRIASDEPAGTGDPEPTACLRPYVAAESVWGRARSGARLAPAGETPGRAAEINSGV
ncbi:hypothetical protein [Streptomyces olivaceoviridis]|uniref:hypothetical protein n=1 Tax=Streptomyces olivaceoviridis TaxID=1921 RepID=UPI0036FC0B02